MPDDLTPQEREDEREWTLMAHVQSGGLFIADTERVGHIDRGDLCVVVPKARLASLTARLREVEGERDEFRNLRAREKVRADQCELQQGRVEQRAERYAEALREIKGNTDAWASYGPGAPTSEERRFHRINELARAALSEGEK